MERRTAEEIEERRRRSEARRLRRGFRMLSGGDSDTTRPRDLLDNAGHYDGAGCHDDPRVRMEVAELEF